MDIPAKSVDGNDVVSVYQAARQAVGRARGGEGPSFIECVTYRWHGHHMGDQGDTYGYRTQDEVELWMEKCPIERFRNQLLVAGLMDQIEMQNIEDTVRDAIVEAVEFAKEAPYPDESEALEDVYA
jgi:pyruvate dehydrogenase E1 component alpha subunit